MLASFVLPLVLLTSAVTAAWVPSTDRKSNVVPDAYIIQVDSVALAKRGILPVDTIRMVLDQVSSVGILYTVRQQIEGGTLFQGASIKVSPGVTANDLLQVAGVNVCMLDSGIDYTNPILGGCFGPGCHVSVGYDFVGDNYNGNNEPVASADPYSTCDPHGTHVSGILGALANKYGFSGVAPEASIGMFRVLGCGGDTDDDIVLQAYMMAMKSGCNIINMSLAGPAGWLSNTPTELMVEVAEQQGIFTVACMGNDGAEGLFYSQQPASAVQNIPAYNATLLGHSPLTYLSPTPFNATNLSPGYRLFFTSLNASSVDDACSPLPSGTPDLGNYVVIVQRGTCDFTTKWANIVAAGGRYVILYNSPDATQQLYLDKGTSGLYALATMRHADGVNLLNEFITDRARLVIKFPASPLVPGVVDTIVGGLVSSTSNYGPTLDLFGGPTLSAPGVNIISTYPLVNGGVGVLSGTSMSSPFIAGAAALIMSARASEGLTVAQVKGLIATTSQIVTVARNPTSAYVTAPLQGSGLIQVDVALAAKTFVTPSVLLLNDTTYFNGVQTITVKNTNPFTTFYTMDSRSAPGQGLYDSSNNILPAPSPPTVSAAQAGVSFSRGRMTLASGATGTFTVTFTPPSMSDSDAALYPIYSGWILINGTPVAGGSARESYTVQYFGLSGSMFNLPILDTSSTINGVGYTYPFIATPNDIQLLPTTYTFPVGPLILTRFAMGSPYTSIDLVAGNITFLGTILSDNNAASSRSRRSVNISPSRMQTRQSRALFSDTVTIGNIYNAGYQPRSARLTSSSVDQENQFSGTYTTADNVVRTVERAVSYRILVRACKITGDAQYEDQYESWLSPSFLYSP
ncbi:hypothetical protein RQP46_005894 [Phenoliferia psychrophenolica]